MSATCKVESLGRLEIGQEQGILDRTPTRARVTPQDLCDGDSATDAPENHVSQFIKNSTNGPRFHVLLLYLLPLIFPEMCISSIAAATRINRDELSTVPTSLHF